MNVGAVGSLAFNCEFLQMDVSPQPFCSVFPSRAVALFSKSPVAFLMMDPVKGLCLWRNVRIPNLFRRTYVDAYHPLVNIQQPVQAHAPGENYSRLGTGITCCAFVSTNARCVEGPNFLPLELADNLPAKRHDCADTCLSPSWFPCSHLSDERSPY